MHIVFLDIDGTLIGPDFVCPPSARAAVQAARAKGHLVCLCTGRQRSIISDDILNIGFDGIVSAGGARIEVGSELLFQSFIPDGTLRRIVNYFDEYSVPYVLERKTEMTASHTLFPYFELLRARAVGTPDERRVADGIDMFMQTTRAFVGTLGSYRDVAKIVFIGGSGVSVAQVKEEFADTCDVFRSSISIFGSGGGEVSLRGVHKGSALEILAKHYGLTKADAIAIGDSDNDRTMLEAAGVGIAMGNADADLQKSADYVTSRIEDDGLYKAFEKYNLL
jgi:Cof subfamily protein (haloacid dehalogenase superfamily)